MRFSKLAAIWLALCFGLLGAHAQLAQTGAGKSGGGGGVTFVGAGDVSSGAKAWWSCSRGYSAAYATPGTNPACDLVAITGGAAVCTLRIATTGFVDLAASYCAGTTPAAACAAASGGSCRVAKAYDQSGALQCTGAACDITQATLANMPDLTFSALGGLPGMTFLAANSQQLRSASMTTFSQPNTYSTVIERNANFAAAGAFYGDGGGGITMLFQNVANTGRVFAGTNQTYTVADSAFHALQIFTNGASSAVFRDGTNLLIGNIGAGTRSGVNIVGQDAFASGFLSAILMEFGVWNGDTTANNAAMDSNQHGAANGYNF